MRRTILSLVALVAMFMTATAQKAPDFAFPRDVQAQATTDLADALRANDADATVNALIRIGLSETLISPDSVIPFIGQVNQLRLKEKRPVTRSLLALLQATALRGYYDVNRWELDSRTTVSDSGDDITLYSGDRIKNLIRELVMDALADPKALILAPITDYPGTIAIDYQSVPFYPSVYDFAASYAVGNLLYEQADRLDIISRWEAMHPAPSAARIAALMARCDVVPDTDALALYHANDSTPYAIELLMQRAVTPETYPYVKEFAATHPDYFRIDVVKSRLDYFLRPEVSLNCPLVAHRNSPARIDVTYSNVRSLKIHIFRIPKKFEEWRAYTKISFLGRAVSIIDVPVKDSIPYSDAKADVQFTLTEYGRYIAVPEVDGSFVDSKISLGRDIVCSDLSVLCSGNTATSFAVDNYSGAPVEDVTLLTHDSRLPSRLPSIKSDAEGRFNKVKWDVNRYVALYPAKGNDRWSPVSDFAFFGNKDYGDGKKYCNVDVKMELPVYHPGDTARLVAIVYYPGTANSSGYGNPSGNSAKGLTHELIAGRDIRMVLHDANYQPVDTIVATTDAMGRLTPSFPLPESGITGNYSVDFSFAGDYPGYELGGSRSFMVSDYKRPEIIVTLDPIKADSGNYVISGSVMTYSGFPLAQSCVSVSLVSRRPFFYYGSRNEKPFQILDAVTGDNGRFSVSVPIDSVRAKAKYPDGLLVANVSATSPSGETQQAFVTTVLSAERHIIVNNDYINYSAVTAKGLPVEVTDVAGRPVDSDITISFQSTSDTIAVATRSVESFAEVDFSRIPSGSYSLSITAPEVKEPCIVKNITVYRPEDTASPSLKHLWAPSYSINATVGAAPLELLYATSSDEIYVLATISVDGEVERQWWLPRAAGMQKVRVDIPDRPCKMSLTLTSVWHNNEISEIYSIKVSDPADSLKIEVEHLRDYVTPGSKGSLTLKVTDGNGSPVKGAAILDIYNKSIDAIVKSDNSLHLAKATRGNYFYLNSTAGRTSSSSFNQSVKRIDTPAIVAPEFNFYGYGFGYNPRAMLLVRGTKMYKSEATDKGAIRSYLMADEAGTGRIVHEEAEVEDAAAPMASANGLEEIAGSAPVEDPQSVSYRQAEVPLALFAPSLMTDESGRVDISFTWPDANTTWVVNALAYNSGLAVCGTVREVIASRPVMVSANAPRFLRHGDSCDIAVMVMNARDSIISARLRIDLLDPFDNTPLAQRRDSVLTLAPKASSTVTVPVEVPATGGAMVLRVSVTADNCTDAEQHLIPILQASQPVIESEGFYLAPTEKSVTVDLPQPAAGNDDATLTLTFTANPVWEVLTALPGMRQYNPSTSPAAMANIFSLAVAKGIIDENPTVVKRLGEWLRDNASDSLALSKLARNPQLKQLALDATPWVGASQSQSLQMARLGLMLDSDATDRSLDEAVEALDKFRDRSSGGYRWGDFSNEPSVFATENVAYMLGRLRELSMLSGMKSEAEGAMRYLDRELQESLKRDHDGYDIFFTYLCSLHPDYCPSSAAAAANRRALAHVRGNWKKAPVATKALWASLLWRNGEKAVAEEILRSLTQYSTVTPDQGRFWDTLSSGTWWASTPLISTSMVLDAYTLINPGASEIDQIRQWMVYNKIAQGWGGSPATSSVVASVLQSGSQWLTAPDDLYVTVDGKSLELTEGDRLTGSVTASLPLTGGMLRVLRSGDNPAWGAVISRYIAPMGDIKAASCNDLSVEKHNLVMRDGKWIEAGELRLGDIVKVRLTIKARRRIDFVTVTDNRAAALEPVVQTPRYVYSGAFPFYLENRDNVTNLFVDVLPKGTYMIEYEMKVNNAGTYSSGIATVQSQYAPEYTAHSSSHPLVVLPQ